MFILLLILVTHSPFQTLRSQFREHRWIFSVRTLKTVILGSLSSRAAFVTDDSGKFLLGSKFLKTAYRKTGVLGDIGLIISAIFRLCCTTKRQYPPVSDLSKGFTVCWVAEPNSKPKFIPHLLFSQNPCRLVLKLQDLVFVGKALQKGRHQLTDRWKETNREAAGQTGRAGTT